MRTEGKTKMKKNNIILIGMPGVGKSTIGVILAKMLGYTFIDADIVIQNEEKRLLKDIIASEGVEGFIRIENRINSNIVGEKCIIATGGSVVYGKEAMEHYKEIGRILYLKVGFDTLKGRLKDIKGRGVVLRNGQDLDALYKERTPLYEEYADLTVAEDGLTIEQTIEKIMEIL